MNSKGRRGQTLQWIELKVEEEATAGSHHGQMVPGTERGIPRELVTQVHTIKRASPKWPPTSP
jgi:hypothetical protein